MTRELSKVSVIICISKSFFFLSRYRRHCWEANHLSREPLKLGNDHTVHTSHTDTPRAAAPAPEGPRIEKGFMVKRRGREKRKKKVAPSQGGTVLKASSGYWVGIVGPKCFLLSNWCSSWSTLGRAEYQVDHWPPPSPNGHTLICMKKCELNTIIKSAIPLLFPFWFQYFRII